MKAKRFGAWIIQKIAVSLSLEGPANSRSPRAQSKATAGAFPEGLLTLTTVWAEQRCPETLATLQLFNLCLLSWGWGQPHYSQQGLGASLVHARPGRGHPKQLDQVCTPLGRIPAACNGSTKAAMPENGLLEDGVSGDQSSLPTKHAFCSFLMSLKVCPLAVWRTWYPALRGRCKDKREASVMKFSSCLRQVLLSFPAGASDKECRRHKRLGFDPWVRKMPWRRAWQPTPVSLPGEPHGQRSLAGYSPWGCEESDMTEVT